MREYPLYTPYGHAGIVVDCPYDRTMFESVLVMRLSTPPVHAGVAAACPCGRTLRSWSDVFPCGTAVRVRWTCVAVRGFTSGRARRAAVGRVAPTGRTCPQAPGGNWPDGNTGGIDNYPVCLRHSGQQSHTYYCLLLSVSWFCRCTRPMATCVMAVSVSILLTGRCCRNCLYLNCLGNKSLAKRSF